MGRKKEVFKTVRLFDIADKGLAVGKEESGQIYMVEGGVPGDLVRILKLRNRKGVGRGRIVEVLEYSPHRTEPFCQHFEDCGGCKWQHYEYEEQLRSKNRIVKNAIERIAKCTPGEFGEPVPAPRLTQFRNKLEYTFSEKRWITKREAEGNKDIIAGSALGFHRPGAFDKIVDIDECHLQPEPTNGIRNFIRDYAKQKDLEFFNIREQKGLLRTLMVRTGPGGQAMAVLSCFRDDRVVIEDLLQALLAEFPNLTSVFYVINPKGNDTILDLPLRHFHGRTYIEESLADLEFRIGPKSFFQTNPEQAERLYELALDFAGIDSDSTVYDLYCGLGSITLFAARKAGKVIGIESVPEAVEDARLNASINEIDNVVFFDGEVENTLNEAFFEENGRPEVVIVDPPRAGLHKKVVMALIESGVDRLVYVSCNPATQARDIGLLKESYELMKIRTVDMFPHTSHIETVALLERKTMV